MELEPMFISLHACFILTRHVIYCMFLDKNTQRFILQHMLFTAHLMIWIKQNGERTILNGVEMFHN